MTYPLNATMLPKADGFSTILLIADGFSTTLLKAYGFPTMLSDANGCPTTFVSLRATRCVLEWVKSLTR